jgi:transposase InsO family protein
MELSERLKEVFYGSQRIYGARKLIHALNIRAGRKRIRRLMDSAGLVPVTRRKRVNTTDSKHNLEIFPDLLKQNFQAERINRAWVSDFTYISTDEGWLYLCTVLDLYSRRIVGWAVSDTIDRHLAIAALENAVENRKPAKGFIFHSDRGCQYASSDFRNAVVNYKGIQSMSGKGCPYDNACAESFFKSLKVECLDRQRFLTRQQAKDTVSRYMLFYNRRRIHASLDYLCPVDYEARANLAA